ncbi:MAG TPA: hypothetical protein VHG91_03655 [Longimicrobium sp.]|nr:hypothetical protein [Longimicrobium sp.]
MVPRALEPQLLTSGREVPEGEGWIHEVKYDGYRLLARVDAGGVRLVSRHGNDWTSRLPAVVEAVAALEVGESWLDGELVALGNDGVPRFDALHRAIRGGRGALALVYQVWDAPWLEGRDLRGRCVLERKARLEARVRGHGEGGAVRYADHLRGRGGELFRHAFDAGLEGVVSKRVGSGYRPGVRSRDWVKVKCFRRVRVRVAGFTPGLETLLVCAADGEGGLRYLGRMYGWGAAEVRRELRLALAPLHRPTPPLGGMSRRRREPIQWVEPLVEIEVAALPSTPGETLRHATLRRVVPPGEARAA